MKALIVCISLLLLHGCASTPQTRAIETDGLGALPPVVELSETPFYPQTKYQCGPAALATVLQAQGVNTTPDDLISQVYIPEREGSLQIEMSVSARRHGMLAYPLAPELRDLLTEVAAGHPVLVLQNLSFEWYPQWHYAVVIGYNAETQDIVLRSGTTRRWVTPLNVFERTWQRAKHWALVIVPAGVIPKTAKPLPYIKTAYAFEETGANDLAQRAYQAATQHWPDEAIAWISYGNALLTAQNWNAASHAFNKAVEIEPASIISWNNMAYALHAEGCKADALKALQCGLKISPDDKNLRDSFQELSDKAAQISRHNCPDIHCKQ